MKLDLTVEGMQGPPMLHCRLICLVLLATLLGHPTDAVADDAARLVARMRVEGDGFCRISRTSLRGVGIDSAAYADVTRAGRRVAICPPDEDGS
ncbi:MAG: hypothetical protein GY946_05650, partial [bacterium]|nr:hypothetical protein [bacterium]